MIGKVNSAGGIKRLVMAQAENSAASGDVYVTLTCDFDPLVIFAYGSFYTVGKSEAKWRLTKDGNWTSSNTAHHTASDITVSGRTITAGPYRSSDSTGGYGYVFAFGFPD